MISHSESLHLWCWTNFVVCNLVTATNALLSRIIVAAWITVVRPWVVTIISRGVWVISRFIFYTAGTFLVFFSSRWGSTSSLWTLSVATVDDSPPSITISNTIIFCIQKTQKDLIKKRDTLYYHECYRLNSSSILKTRYSLNKMIYRNITFDSLLI